MSVSSLFAELAETEKQIAFAEVENRAEDLTRLDTQYEQIWADILRYQPASSDIAELMLVLLLDKLIDCTNRGESHAQLREKILELFQDEYMRNGKVVAGSPFAAQIAVVE